MLALRTRVILVAVGGLETIATLQIGVRGRVLSSEHAHFENFRPPDLKRVLSTENSYS